MKHANRWHRFVSLALCLGMLLQSVAPAVAVPRPASEPTASAGDNRGDRTADRAPAGDERTAIQPAGMSQPLTVARTQSGFSADAPLVITYTLQNNLAQNPSRSRRPAPPSPKPWRRWLLQPGCRSRRAAPKHHAAAATPTAAGAIDAVSQAAATANGNYVFQFGRRCRRKPAPPSSSR